MAEEFQEGNLYGAFAPMDFVARLRFKKGTFALRARLRFTQRRKVAESAKEIPCQALFALLYRAARILGLFFVYFVKRLLSHYFVQY